MIPAEKSIDFLFEAKKTTSDGIKQWLDRLQKGIQKDPSSSDFESELLKLCELIAGNSQSKPHDLGVAIEVAISHSRADIIESAMSVTKLPISTFRMFGEALHVVDMPSIRNG